MSARILHCDNVRSTTLNAKHALLVHFRRVAGPPNSRWASTRQRCQVDCSSSSIGLASHLENITLAPAVCCRWNLETAQKSVSQREVRCQRPVSDGHRSSVNVQKLTFFALRRRLLCSRASCPAPSKQWRDRLERQLSSTTQHTVARQMRHWISALGAWLDNKFERQA